MILDRRILAMLEVRLALSQLQRCDVDNDELGTQLSSLEMLQRSGMSGWFERGKQEERRRLTFISRLIPSARAW